jgi:glutathione S-transferase
MKLYFSPGACSLASRIALHESGLSADFEAVDLKTKSTERGQDYLELNRKGSVPMLVLNDGESVTENAAILAFLADRDPQLSVDGHLGRIRLIEMLSFLSSELHTAFKPLYKSTDPFEREAAAEAVLNRLDCVADHVRELYLFGPRFTVADAYLFVMLRWAKAFDLPLAPQLEGYFERVMKRPAVRIALAEEGFGPMPPIEVMTMQPTSMVLS